MRGYLIETFKILNNQYLGLDNMFELDNNTHQRHSKKLKKVRTHKLQRLLLWTEIELSELSGLVKLIKQR
jgi:hypothetical protein